MLKLNNMSSRNGGSGNIIIASMASMITGAPMPRRPSDLRLSMAVAVAMPVSVKVVASELVRTHQVRINIGFRRRRRFVTAHYRLLELEYVSEHLRHGDIQRRR